MAGLDYSAGRLTAAQIRGAGYSFVIRYIGTPGRTKNITAPEYQDLRDGGIAVALVYENDIGDARGGFNAGVVSARAARADADAIGFPQGRPIYMAIDDVNAYTYLDACMAYLDGAASVLDRENTGVYGFQAPVRAAMQQGKARFFWQCGSRSALVPGAHLYQHNNDNTVVAGIPCDINDALQPDFGQDTAEVDVQLSDTYTDWAGNQQSVQATFNHLDQRLAELHRAFFGGDQPSRIPGDTNHTDLSNAGMDTVARVTLALNAVTAMAAQLTAIQGALSKEEADVLAAVKGIQTGQVDVAALAQALVPLLPPNVTADQLVAAFAAHLSTPTTGH